LTCRAAGAAELKETAIGGFAVVFMVEEPPHATNATITLIATGNKYDWRNVILGIHAPQSWWFFLLRT
jgi:hypothetical protein